jgi:hypothetical protein
MEKETRNVHNNVIGFTDPYEESIKSLCRDLDEQIEATKKQLEYLESLRDDLKRQYKQLAA